MPAPCASIFLPRTTRVSASNHLMANPSKKKTTAAPGTVYMPSMSSHSSLTMILLGQSGKKRALEPEAEHRRTRVRTNLDPSNAPAKASTRKTRSSVGTAAAKSGTRLVKPTAKSSSATSSSKPTNASQKSTAPSATSKFAKAQGKLSSILHVLLALTKYSHHSQTDAALQRCRSHQR